MAGPNEVEIVVSGKDKSGPAYDSARRGAQRFEQEAGQSAKGLGDSFQDVGGILGKLGPIGAAAGAAVGAALAGAALAANKLKAAIDASVQRTKAAALAGAQGLGTDPERIREVARTAGKLYGDNFAASIEDATRAVRDVFRSGLIDEDAGEDAIRRISEKLITLAQVAEDDTTRVATAIETLLRTGLVQSADEAFDVLTRGFQQGADKGQDLIDTLVEYPTQFRKLGLSAAEATGILSQGLAAGARNADVVADALKEFSIRAVDGSKLTGEGFRLLGLNGEKMGREVARGGDRAQAALQLTLDRLRAIKDPVLQAQAAVALFGTQAEDLGSALFAIDPKRATDALGDLAGATDKATKALSDSAPWTEQLSRKWQALQADLGDRLMPAFNRVGQWFGEFSREIAPVIVKHVKMIADGFRLIWEKALPQLRNLLELIKQKWEENRASIEKLTPLLKLLGIVIGVTLVTALVTVAGGVLLLIEYMGRVGDTFGQAKEDVQILVLALLDGFGKILNGAVSAFGWIPGIGPKLKDAQAQFNRFAEDVRRSIEGIPEQRIVDIRLQVSGLSQVASAIQRVAGVSSGIGARAHGGVIGAISGAANGGVRNGLVNVGEHGRELALLAPGPAMLPPGSTVIPNGATERALSGGGSSGGVRQVGLVLDDVGDDWLAEILNRLLRQGKLRAFARA